MDKRQKQIKLDYIIKSKSTAKAVAKIFIKMLWGYWTLTITGTIYRNGKFFRDVKKSYKVEGNTPSPTPVNKPTKPAKVTVKKTTLKSAKKVKIKK